MSESSSCPPRSSGCSSAYAARPSRSCLHPPTLLHIADPDSPSSQSSLLQFSIHRAPVTLRKEVAAVCPSLRSQPGAAELLLVPTFQRVRTPLIAVTPETEAEKNRLLETVSQTAHDASAVPCLLSLSPWCCPCCALQFSGFARSLCLLLQGRGYFADYIDPCTGHPALHARSSSVYSEVEAASQLLRYRVEQAGSCSVVLHPDWGSACYPASIVTSARIDALLTEMQAVRRRWEVQAEREQPGQGESGSAGPLRSGQEEREEREEREADAEDGGRQQQQPHGVKKGEEELKQLDEPQLLTAGQQERWIVREEGGRRGGSQAGSIAAAGQAVLTAGGCAEPAPLPH